MILSNNHQNPRLTRKRRQFLKMSLATLSGFALSNCGWRLGQVRSIPNQGDQTKLSIFTGGPYTDTSLLKQFKQKMGISVTADVFESNEEMLARYQAGGGQAYSVIYPSDYMVTQMVELGLLTELEQPQLLRMNEIKKRFQNSAYDPDNRHSIPLSWGTTGFIYNSKKLTKHPTDWEYLWENKEILSRKMSLLNDVREVMGASLKMLGYSLNSTNPKEVKHAYDKLVELKPFIASFTNDSWRSQILTGDLLLAMCYSSDANELTAENTDLKYVLPKSGSSLWMDTMVIPKTAPNPMGGYQWLNYMMQPEIAAEICVRLSFATASSTAYQLLPASVRANSTLFPSDESISFCESIKPLGDFTEVFDRYWTQLTSS
jgi:spermidine/putrescine transport system substrate-binding protein